MATGGDGGILRDGVQEDGVPKGNEVLQHLQ